MCILFREGNEEMGGIIKTCTSLPPLHPLPALPSHLPYQTASGHTDVQGSRLTQGPVLDLFGVTDVEAEATGAAVEFAALEALDWGQVGRRLAGGPAGT